MLHITFITIRMSLCCVCNHNTGEQEGKLSLAKQEIEARWHKRMERDKEAVSEKLLDSLDHEGRAELMDNGWLKREVCCSLPHNKLL